MFVTKLANSDSSCQTGLQTNWATTSCLV